MAQRQWVMGLGAHQILFLEPTDSDDERGDQGAPGTGQQGADQQQWEPGEGGSLSDPEWA